MHKWAPNVFLETEVNEKQKNLEKLENMYHYKAS